MILMEKGIALARFVPLQTGPVKVTILPSAATAVLRSITQYQYEQPMCLSFSLVLMKQSWA